MDGSLSAQEPNVFSAILIISMKFLCSSIVRCCRPPNLRGSRWWSGEPARHAAERISRLGTENEHLRKIEIPEIGSLPFIESDESTQVAMPRKAPPRKSVVKMTLGLAGVISDSSVTYFWRIFPSACVCTQQWYLSPGQ